MYGREDINWLIVIMQKSNSKLLSRYESYCVCKKNYEDEILRKLHRSEVM